MGDRSGVLRQNVDDEVDRPRPSHLIRSFFPRVREHDEVLDGRVVLKRGFERIEVVSLDPRIGGDSIRIVGDDPLDLYVCCRMGIECFLKRELLRWETEFDDCGLGEVSLS